jgi:hypothetical protein
MLLLVENIKFRQKFGLQPSMGLMSMAACLGRHSIPVRIIDPNLYIKRGDLSFGSEISAELAKFLSTHKPTAVGFNLINETVLYTMAIARRLKDILPDVLIIGGGPHATALGPRLLEYSKDFDICVMGEAEDTIVELMQSIDAGGSLEGVKGLIFRNRVGDIIMNERRPLIEDLDSLPMPGIEYVEYSPEYIHVDVGRGCPYDCNFCFSSLLWERRSRMKSVGRIIDEIKFFKEKTGGNRYYLYNDNLSVDKQYLHALCRAIKNSGIGIEWSCMMRFDNLNMEDVDILEESGCTAIYFGVETMSPRLQSVIGKHAKVEKLPCLLEKLSDKTGLIKTLSFINGFPEQTYDELETDLQYIWEWSKGNNFDIQYPILWPTPNSRLFNDRYDDICFDGMSADYLILPASLADRWKNEIKHNRDIYSSYHYFQRENISRHITLAATHFIILFKLIPAFIAYWRDRIQGSFMELLTVYADYLARNRDYYKQSTDTRKLDLFCEEMIEDARVDDVATDILKYYRLLMGQGRRSGGGGVFFCKGVYYENFQYSMSDLIKYDEFKKYPSKKRYNSIIVQETDDGKLALTSVYNKEVSLLLDRISNGISKKQLDGILIAKGGLRASFKVLKEKGIVGTKQG